MAEKSNIFFFQKKDDASDDIHDFESDDELVMVLRVMVS